MGTEILNEKIEGKQSIATLRERPLTLASATVFVISGDTVRRSGARYFTDILRMVPGMEVMRTSSTESNVSVRGYSDASSAAQGMMVLIDGRQAYNEFYGNAFWDSLPVSLDEIKRVEVIRGPSSFLYGPNAMHGLVIIVTKTPKDYGKDTMKFSTNYGTYHSTVSTFTYVKWDKADKAGLKATVIWDDISQFDPGRYDTRNKRVLLLSYLNQIGNDEKHVFGLSGTVSQQEFNLLVPLLGLPVAEYTSELREGTLKADYQYDDVKLKVSWAGFNGTSVADRIYPAFKVDLDTVDLDLQYPFQLMDDHFFTVGAGYRYAGFSTAEPDVSNGSHSTDLGWTFLQDEIELTPDLFATVGMRWDRHSTAGNNTSPRGAIVWRMQPRQSLRVSIGEGFRNPSLRENFFNMPITVPGAPASIFVEGNRNLVSERMRSHEIGFSGWFFKPIEVQSAPGDPESAKTENEELTASQEPKPKQNQIGRLRIGANVFYNRIDNLIQFQPVAFFPGTTIASRVAPVNQDNEEAFGFELEAKWVLSAEMVWFGNYSWTIRRNRETHARNLLAPRHKGNLGVRWSPSNGLRAMLWATYFDGTELNGNRVGDFIMLNGSMSIQLGNYENARWYISGFNMLDQRHKEHAQADSYGALVSTGIRITF